ncbi:MAG: hypothetical protein KA444_01945 [Bacteroidia bacterium]|nr:hypothetical protein [Bacteroidia bacterium]
MAINQNHQFEDLEGQKCAIVEKNLSDNRVSFLKNLLELNGFVVIIVPSPPPKAAAATPDSPEVQVETPKTFTLGVTDVRFNSTNAIFGRMLHSEDGRVVTMDYWQQKELVSEEDIPYFVRKGRSSK